MEETNAVTQTAEPITADKNTATLEQLAADMQKNRKHERTQAVMSVVRTIASILTLLVIVYALWTFAPRVTTLMDNLDQISADIQAMDLPGMSESVTELATEGTAGINTALEDVSRAIGVLEKLDIEGLNKSISDLGAVVQPLAKLFGKK